MRVRMVDRLDCDVTTMQWYGIHVHKVHTKTKTKQNKTKQTKQTIQSKLIKSKQSNQNNQIKTIKSKQSNQIKTIKSNQNNQIKSNQNNQFKSNQNNQNKPYQYAHEHSQWLFYSWSVCVMSWTIRTPHSVKIRKSSHTNTTALPLHRTVWCYTC